MVILSLIRKKIDFILYLKIQKYENNCQKNKYHLKNKITKYIMIKSNDILLLVTYYFCFNNIIIEYTYKFAKIKLPLTLIKPFQSLGQYS